MNTDTRGVSKFRRWMRALADFIHGRITGRTRPATHRRREEENILAIQQAVAESIETKLSLQQSELDMLWDRHDRRRHHRT